MTMPLSYSPQAQQQLNSLLPYVRQHSPFYSEFYAEVPAESRRLSDYPILDSARFWAANTPENSQVLTQSPDEGITFKSGGTTGAPKFSIFTHQEWARFTHEFGMGMRKAGLQAKDHIGNLFYAGKLYASFLFITRSIEAAGVGISYPIGGDDLDEILSLWRQFRFNVLAGVPTTLMKLLERLTPHDKQHLNLQTFLYGGEPMFADQIAAVQAVFPSCKVRSIGVAGVDYGELGWAHPSGEPGAHCSFQDSTIMEIIDDETGQVIMEPGVAGKIVLTSLYRRLMPVIRYPVGDKGMWLDAPDTPDRGFQLLGRTEEGARVGPMTLYIDDIHKVVKSVEAIQGFQLLISHFDQRDACSLRIATSQPEQKTAEQAQAIIEHIYRIRPMYVDLLEQNLVHPLQIEWVNLDALYTNPRTGKLLRVIDQRHVSA